MTEESTVFTVTITLNGDLIDYVDFEAAEERAEEIARGLAQLAQDLDLRYVSTLAVEVEPL